MADTDSTEPVLRHPSGRLIAAKPGVVPPVSAKDIARFWSKVAKAGPDECWLWMAGQFKETGYGQFYLAGRPYPAHVIARWFTTNEWPDGLFTCHACDERYPLADKTNRRCCNPAHLFLGTHKDNMADAARKNRMPKGERSGAYTHPESRRTGEKHHSHKKPETVARGERCRNAKMTEQEVREIRVLHAAGNGYQAISQQFGIDPHTVWCIVTRRTWKHVP